MFDNILPTMTDVKMLNIEAAQTRLPTEAAKTLRKDEGIVCVQRYGRAAWVAMSGERFRLVEPLLRLIEEGAPLSPESFTSKADLAIQQSIAPESGAVPEEAAQIAEIIANLTDR